MKAIIALAFLSTALAAPQFNNRPYRPQSQFSPSPAPSQQYNAAPRNVVPIIEYSNDINPDGSYQYRYQTGDGISAQANAVVRATGQRDSENSVATAVTGSYSYTAPDGQIITINYIADENGYRAEGAAIPTPPPIPEAIARSLNLNQVAQVGGQSNAGFRTSNQFQAGQNRYQG